MQCAVEYQYMTNTERDAFFVAIRSGAGKGAAGKKDEDGDAGIMELAPHYSYISGLR